MAKKVYDQDGLDMSKVNWDGDESTGYLPVSGRLVENYIKGVANQTGTVEELAHGETRAPQAGVVFDSMVGTVMDLDVHDSEDGTQYVMTVTQKDAEGGQTEKEVRFSKYTDDDKVIVNIDLTDGSGAELPSSQYLALGDGFVIKYAINVGTVGGSEISDYSDLKARVVVRRGSTILPEFQNSEFAGVTAGQTYTMDISPYLLDATTYTVQVEAKATYQGKELTKTATARVTMVAITLDTVYSVGNGVEDGGYNNDVSIPFTLKGTTGEKNIYYRLNGGIPYTLSLSGGSGIQSKNIVIPLSDLKVGLNVVEAYAIHEGSGVISRVYYISILRSGDVTDYAGIMFGHKANGFQSDWRNPIINAEQFTAWNFTYAAYNKESNTSNVKIESKGVIVKEDKLFRGDTGTYGRTNVSVDPLIYEVTCGSAIVTVAVNTVPHSDIEATLSPDADCTFYAFGRSNSENNAASWISGDKYMEFKDVLWSVNENGAGSGWYNDRLLLSNGASMTLTTRGGYHPFNESEKPVGQTIRDIGMTLEIEYSTDNVTDTNAELISCLGTLPNGNRYGLVITPEEAKFLTGVVTEAMDAGQLLRYEDSVGTKFEPGKNIKISYVFYPRVETNEQRGLIGFYVNGIESAASSWVSKVDFNIMSQLTFNSNGADLYIKNIRIYNKALTSDEVLNNYIVDRNHLEDTADELGVRSLDEDNRVMSEGDTVSMDKLMGLIKKRKNSILVLIGTGSVGSEVPSESDTLNVMDALAQLNNKKANKLCREVRFYNGENRELDFIARDIYLRIQGTSSVNYARKNLRFYFQKTASGYTARMTYGEIDGNGQQNVSVETTGKKNLFRLRQNSVGVKLACAKCDFSDSSMTTNTGGAKFINDGFKEMGILTPAQKYAGDHPDTCNLDIRAAIDGLPCDLFVAKTVSDDFVYYGQYNMNNEKSDSYPIFGQDDEIGSEVWGEGDTLSYLQAGDDGDKQYLPMSIETLNNSNNLCLFRWLPSTETYHTDFMDNNFDDGFELNHPKDTFWNSGGGDADEEPNMKDHIGSGDVYDKMYKALDRMMSFIYKCVKETPAGSNLTYNPETHTFEGVDYEDDGNKFPTDKWISATFKRDATKYFDIPYWVSYYLYVDFNLGVDQLAKNMLIRTWDGVIWYTTYYDGDCQLGSDNKSFLTGKYDDNRQTKRDGAYVMQGHNSWLWNLILANFHEVMEEIMTNGYSGGTSFLSAFSVQRAIDHFDKEQMARWCARLYNESGIFKYVYPFLNPMKVGADGAEQTYPQIYGMKGSLEAHRSYFIRRRYDLKQVEYGYMSTLGSQFYQSTASLDAAYILKPMQFVLTIPYRVQISTSNGVQADSGLVEANTLHALSLRGSFGENDPLKIIGASKIKELIWHDDAFAIGFNFGLFTSLVKLDMSVESSSGYRNNSFMTSTNALTLLEELNMRNNMLARNGDSGRVATLDLSYQSRLKKLDLWGTGITKLVLATGTPLVSLSLPGTLEELFLEYLPNLKESDFSLEGISNIIGYRFESCPGINGLALLERLHNAKKEGNGKLERFRIHIDTEDDGTILEEYYSYGSYTSMGMTDMNHSGLYGIVRMTSYLEEERMERYRNRYPELTIINTQYTVLISDTDVADDSNYSNLDNKTGYIFSNKYVLSGHVAKILSMRFGCLGKQTVEGKMSICPLHNDNFNYYADSTVVSNATPAALDGTEGDAFMYEPNYWYKGINDILGVFSEGVPRNYSCYSSNKSEPDRPSPSLIKVLTLDNIKSLGNYINGVKVRTGSASVSGLIVEDSNYSVCVVSVEGYRYVRFPTVLTTSMEGAAFVGSDESILKNVVIEKTGAKIVNGMYVISDIPAGAKTLYFSIHNKAEFDCVVLSNSTKPEDMEPDWVLHENCLAAMFEAISIGDKIYSAAKGVQPLAVSNEAFLERAAIRHLQLIDWEMHKDVANLFYAKYGRRDAQEQCGYGQNAYPPRTVGQNAFLGMKDTVQKEGATEFAWYDNMGALVRVNNVQVLGYENFYGNVNEFLCKATIPELYRLLIIMPDGSERKISFSDPRNNFVKFVYHQKYMDVLQTNNSTDGTATTFYTDHFLYYGGTNNNTTVKRSGKKSETHGGIIALDITDGMTVTNMYYGTRLAFRGEIEIIRNVSDFKLLESAF